MNEIKRLATKDEAVALLTRMKTLKQALEDMKETAIEVKNAKAFSGGARFLFALEGVEAALWRAEEVLNAEPAPWNSGGYRV